MSEALGDVIFIAIGALFLVLAFVLQVKPSVPTFKIPKRAKTGSKIQQKPGDQRLILWWRFSQNVDCCWEQLNCIKYDGLRVRAERPLTPTQSFIDISKGEIPYEQTQNILSEQFLGPPHGLSLLELRHNLKLPPLPEKPPGQPPDHYLDSIRRYQRLSDAIEVTRVAFNRRMAADQDTMEGIKRGVLSDRKLITEIINGSFDYHYLPEFMRKPTTISIDLENRVVLCDIEIPDFINFKIVTKRGKTQKASWLPVSKADRRTAIECVIYSLCIRAAYIAAMSDVGNNFETIAVNAKQQWTDTATGARREGVIASIQASKDEISKLKIGHIEPKACFRYLKGLMTPSIDQLTPIRPIFVLNTADARITLNRDVVDYLDQHANLAVMPWDDFEHLVRQLFEWEFGRNGVEVKVTRASRDRGVDAIMFDPDPLRGGKYVLQAKRYTRTVDVAAVRDLYGTIVNEGANRGILVTTSSYGPDSYEFAKDKPISLVDGPNLIAMLTRHGRRFHIDLAEARRLEAAQKKS